MNIKCNVFGYKQPDIKKPSKKLGYKLDNKYILMQGKIFGGIKK